MELERVAAALRPRRPWEGLDLGFVLARRWIGTLWPLWWLGTLPAALLAVAVLGGALGVGADWWLVALWWLKPVYEAPLVVWTGRALFGERPSLTAIRPVLRAAWTPRLLPFLLWRRLSPVRSFVLPIALLEGLSGREARARQRVLSGGDGTAAWLTVVGYHFEAILWGGALLALFFMVPEGLPRLDLEEAMTESKSWPYWLSAVLYLTASSIVAPFYVAGGFALYLTRRTELEAWDLELAFRRPYGARPAGPARGNGGSGGGGGSAGRGRAPGRGADTRRGTLTAGLAVLGLLALLAWPAGEPEAHTLPEPSEARAIVEEVLADETFGGTREVQVWVPVERAGRAEGKTDARWLKTLADALVAIAPFVKWLVLAAAAATVAVLALKVARDRRPRVRLRRRPGVALGADALAADAPALPADLAAAVRERLAAGDPRGALGLLYRGGIAYLVQIGVAVPAGATEGECLALAARRLGREGAVPFRDLTRDWQALAYAHRVPSRETVVRRLDAWLAWTGAPAPVDGPTGAQSPTDPAAQAARDTPRDADRAP